MKSIYIIGIFFICNLIFLAYNLYQKHTLTQGINTVVESVALNPTEKNTNEIIESQEAPDTIEDTIHAMSEDAIVQEELYQNMYNDFKQIKDYQWYAEYIETYPQLLVLVYAVRREDKKTYIKFYDFIYEKTKKEEKYFSDIEMLVGQKYPDMDTKEGFLKIMWEHYDTVVDDEFSFKPIFGDGPLHIALSNDDIETAKKHCDASQISGVNDETKEECYNYIYAYRATIENNLCDQIVGKYQKNVCVWALQEGY